MVAAHSCFRGRRPCSASGQREGTKVRRAPSSLRPSKGGVFPTTTRATAHPIAEPAGVNCQVCVAYSYALDGEGLVRMLLRAA